MTSPNQDYRLYLYNTLSNQKELFSPKHNPIRLYTCGPTVYDFAHLGNFRTYVFEDLLKRTLLFLGYNIHHVMNITDVDDKTLTGAYKKGVSLQEYTKPFIEAFFEDLTCLGIHLADHYPKATDYIPQMISAIQELLQKNIAYQAKDGSIYFAIDQFPHYGKLSSLCLKSLERSTRTVNDEYDKENISDFVLWKMYDPSRDGNTYWDSPFGKGRPGWHIECSVMSMELLGSTLDIHAGGVDNIFPHHENEIAQSECLSNKQFVQYWLHSEHLLIDGKKMSKSLGNFFTLRDLLNEGFTGKEIRYLLLQSHYRMQLNFTKASLQACRKALIRINEFIYRLKNIHTTTYKNTQIPIIVTNFLQEFTSALCNDLNISIALASLFNFIHTINDMIDKDHINTENANDILIMLENINSILNIMNFEDDTLPQNISSLVQERQKARENKDWKLSDILRDQLLEMGYLIEDSKQGPRVKKIKSL